jgi:molecular chaperone GrpE
MAKKLQDQVKELTDMLQRVQAEFENYRKRKEAEMCKFAEGASKELVFRLLPVLDSFELALKTHVHDGGGVELLYSQLIGVLEGQGLKDIQQMSMFDPRLHEALMVEESKEPQGKILEVFQKGYMLGDCVLRPAKVKVAKCSSQKIPQKK